jgi:hypothetical protein
MLNYFKFQRAKLGFDYSELVGDIKVTLDSKN